MTWRVLALSLLAAAWTVQATAEPTTITVRVLAKGAKFVGSETGGVHITLTDADSGAVLAEGVTEGSTGNTAKIMKDGHARGDVLSDAMSAKFSTTLDLDYPRRITVTADGPLGTPGSTSEVSSTQWVLPGKSVDGGDGWLLELPGFAITLPEGVAHTLALTDGKASLPLQAKVTMMCGCPLTPGGLWDANRIEVAARIQGQGVPARTVPLAYAGKPSMFSGTVPFTAPGDYVVDLYAYDPSDGNTGLYRMAVRVR